MLRNLALFLCFASLVLFSCLIISCGGSSHNTACTGGPFDVVGDWNLTLNNAPGDGGVIDTTGLALFFDGAGDVVAVPGITGACSFSGSGTIYAAGGGGTASFTTTGNVTSASSISGTATGSNGSANFSAATITPLTGSVAAVNSSMTAEIAGDPNADIWTLTVAPTGTNADMTFTGPNGANTCTISGTFTQEGTGSANLNVFSYSITFNGAGCPASGTLTGLGFEGSTDYFLGSTVVGTYLYGIPSTAAAVLEIAPLGARQLEHRQKQLRGGRHFSL